MADLQVPNIEMTLTKEVTKGEIWLPIIDKLDQNKTIVLKH